jgi:hypothetical protein
MIYPAGIIPLAAARLVGPLEGEHEVALEYYSALDHPNQEQRGPQLVNEPSPAP